MAAAAAERALAEAARRRQGGDRAGAIALLEAALADMPEQVGLLNEMAGMAREGGDLAAAESYLRRLIAAAPGHSQPMANLAIVLRQSGRHDEALAMADGAIAVNPADAAAHNVRGTTLVALGRYAEAATTLERAVALQDDYVKALSNLGIARKGLGQIGAAIEAQRRALALDPNFADGWLNLGDALLGQGDVEAAIAAFRRVLAIDPGHAGAHSNLIFALDYAVDCSLEQAAAERRAWNARFAAALTRSAPPHDNSRDPERPIRVGYVGGAYLKRGSLGALATGVMLHHDPRQVFSIFYSDVVSPDDYTQRLSRGAGAWRETAALSDAALAAQVRADRVDILVDLLGHMGGSRLGVFARKPAPIQVHAWGNSTGTGLDAMDYFIADRVVLPPERQPHYAERLLYLDSWLNAELPRASPDIVPPPAVSQGHVTFGSFNRLLKLNPPLLATWAEIMAKLPGSRLLLKFRGLDDAATQARFRTGMRAHGIADDRLDFLGGTGQYQHLAAYNRVDLALDPFPHGGGVSTVDALWMGVPCVTVCDLRPSGRASASILTTLGLTEWIAADRQGYVELAVARAGDLALLGRLRPQLRQRFRGSILADGLAFARQVEAAYREIWRRWCKAGSLVPAAPLG
ncbi:MAG: tetratricopeptide repeat protein [Alphaproteobacteria bacterium]|nr:tetratricopeptide repeat protein [Alphaproteobacteria bacterium]